MHKKYDILYTYYINCLTKISSIHATHKNNKNNVLQ